MKKWILDPHRLNDSSGFFSAELERAATAGHVLTGGKKTQQNGSRLKFSFPTRLMDVHIVCVTIRSLQHAFACAQVPSSAHGWTRLSRLQNPVTRRNRFKHIQFELIYQLCSIYSNELITLSLNSSLNPNWFSGFPSGTLYFLNHSTVASK